MCAPLCHSSATYHHTKVYNRYHSLHPQRAMSVPTLFTRHSSSSGLYNINTNQTFATNGLQWKVSVATRHNDPPAPLQLAHLLNSFMWPPWFPKGHIHKGSTSYTQATQRAADSRRLPGLWATGSGRVLVAYWGQQQRRACNTVSSTRGAMRCWAIEHSEFNSSACITPVSSINFYHIGDFFACLCQWHLPLSYSILAHMQIAPSDQVAVKIGIPTSRSSGASINNPWLCKFYWCLPHRGTYSQPLQQFLQQAGVVEIWRGPIISLINSLEGAILFLKMLFWFPNLSTPQLTSFNFYYSCYI
jgi:hypothetical protein